MRNYAVLHVVADESKIFKTKERAPLMLTLEVFRPIELTLCKKPLFVDVADRLDKQEANEVEIIDTAAVRKSLRTLSKSVVGENPSAALDKTFNPFESDADNLADLLEQQK